MKIVVKHLLFIAIIAFGVISFGSLSDCEMPAEQGGQSFDRDKYSSAEARQTWDESHFTDPKHHDPQKFAYIIHTVDHLQTRRSLEVVMDYILNHTAAGPCSTISTSVITEQKQSAFGEIGFILSVPSENILAAKGGDLYSKVLGNNSDPVIFHSSMIDLVNRIGPLISLKQVVEETPVGIYNEILVQGRKVKPISIIGIIAMHPLNGFNNYELYHEAPVLAKKLNLPFIVLNN